MSAFEWGVGYDGGPDPDDCIVISCGSEADARERLPRISRGYLVRREPGGEWERADSTEGAGDG